MRFVSTPFCIAILILTLSGAFAADLTRDEVQAVLSAASSEHGASFASRSLAGLDLHELDFTGADLSGADLSDADLRGAKLVASKLVGARLPRARLPMACPSRITGCWSVA